MLLIPLYTYPELMKGLGKGVKEFKEATKNEEEYENKD